MKEFIVLVRNLLCLFLCFLLWGCQGSQLKEDEENRILGPQSTMAKGEIRVLMVAVRFPDVEPRFPLERVRKRAVVELDDYLREQSYGQAWLKADFKGWIRLPDPISEYSVSPHNYSVDRRRVKKLIEDTMTAVEGEVDFSRYQHMLIIPGAFTTPGKGYGMICYCANPGMLTGVKRNPDYVTLTSKGHREFRGGVFVGAENAHLGMFAHDFFHALGGIHGNKRLAPCLYDFDSQSDPSRSPSPEHHAIYMGPWDIMSEHFVKREEPPPGISSFTRIRLGWISPNQVLLVNPGETAYTFLSPLAKRGEPLAVKIPRKGTSYYLVESRQPLGFDRVLPDSGLLILRVNPDAQEGKGTVQVMDANPGARHFSEATYRVDRGNRNLFLDKETGLAIIPLWLEGENQGVLVTTREKSGDALEAASMIQKMKTRYPESRGKEQSQSFESCLAAFKKHDFKTAVRMGKQLLKD